MSESKITGPSIGAEQFYKLIGRFCVEFEQVCFEMEEAASEVLQISGLQSEALRNILLANLTVDPLQRLLRALLAEHFKDAGFSKILAAVFSRVEALAKTRNSVVHGKWIAPVEDERWLASRQHVLSRRLRTSKAGNDVEYMKYSESDFDAKIADCEQLQKEISFLRYLCARPEKVDRFFDKSTGRLVDTAEMN